MHAPQPHEPPQRHEAHHSGNTHGQTVVVEEPLFQGDHLCCDVCCAVWAVIGFPESLLCCIPYFCCMRSPGTRKTTTTTY